MLTLPHDVLMPRPAALPSDSLLGQMVARLQAENIRYCQCKGCLDLSRVLSGEGDLDLLVDRSDAGRFESVLVQLGFQRAVDPVRPHTPSVLHFYGLDPDTGVLLHLHVYYRLITGGSLLENYRLPLEEMVLSNVRMVEGMPVVQARVALVLFVIRNLVKCSSLSDFLVPGGDRERERAKMEALLADGAEGWEAVLAEGLPGVSVPLFRECLEALRQGAPWLRRWRLGRQLRRQLRSYRCYGPLAEAGLRGRLFLGRAVSRLRWGSGSRKDLAAGGAVIAFIGLDASGKSTLSRETAAWLGRTFRVTRHHLGKPPSAWLTWLPNLARRVAARMAPGVRMSARQGGPPSGSGGLVYRVRMVMLAWDRRALALRLQRRAAHGWLVLCDRYPSPTVGVIDGAALQPPSGPGGGLAGWLARLENRLYRHIPPPDIVIRLNTPAELAVERNRLRHEPGKEKSDAYVAFNHRHVRLPSFPAARTMELHTDRPRTETVQILRRLLWGLL